MRNWQKRGVIDMNNDTYKKKITPLINTLISLNDEAIKIARNIVSNTLFMDDFFFCSLLDKSIHITDGFIEMIKNRNLSCAGIILRVSMDNILRLYALYIVNDKEAFINKFIEGEKLNSFMDKNGNRLTDQYLKEQIQTIDSRFCNVYSAACGYIHFSGKAFYQSTQVIDENQIGFQVSHSQPEKCNEPLIECISAYIHYLRLFYNLISNAVMAKLEFESSQEDSKKN